MDFDADRIYYSHQNLQQQREHLPSGGGDDGAANDAADPAAAGGRLEDEEERAVDVDALRRHFREFLRNYRQGANRYIYRDRLLRMHRRHHASNSDAAQDEGDEGGAD
eukprot:CAMPEP_0172555120 /NCGR_PEP_ID=MMETSP1067-20121228/58060_1 /TAXON_ID=265564 ORGANISM="Thalassiosira punctigera, Strain Tpunct2005C2" /NCGR_SAMPLE_ID=MMETSP1067 /ASSEMBLY_ACC=CAM_ASM_000444 /LENGTH=107 /DNA_ID=CAMNT_0013343629 /DNA_START=120 /DNA_END=440 /DNA_ORIENTATION=+